MNHLFSNIRVIDPAQNLDKRYNLWIKNGKIEHCSSDEPKVDENTEYINGKGLVCSPGFLDMHVHFCEPGYEYKENLKTGSESAINGGFTDVLIMPDTDPLIDNAVVLEYIKQKSQGLPIDIYLSASLSKGSEGNHLVPMIEMDDHGVVMFTDEPHSIQNPDVMRRIFDYAATRDLLISQHCQEMTLSSEFAMNEGALSDKLGMKGFPYVAEEMILARDIMLSEYCDKRRYHAAHISTNGSVRTIRDAKRRGLRVSCEVTPVHFTLDDRVCNSFETNYKLNPPIRRQRDIDAIIEGLSDDTIDCIVSDHTPHALHEKEVEFENAPYGIVGLETALGLTLTNLYHKGYLSLMQLIEKFTVNPRKILQLEQIKIKKGAAADLTVFDPDEEWIVDKVKFKSKNNNTPFDGFNLKGKPKYTITHGEIHTSKL